MPVDARINISIGHGTELIRHAIAHEKGILIAFFIIHAQQQAMPDAAGLEMGDVLEAKSITLVFIFVAAGGDGEMPVIAAPGMKGRSCQINPRVGGGLECVFRYPVLLLELPDHRASRAVRTGVIQVLPDGFYIHSVIKIGKRNFLLRRDFEAALQIGHRCVFVRGHLAGGLTVDMAPNTRHFLIAAPAFLAIGHEFKRLVLGRESSGQIALAVIVVFVAQLGGKTPVLAFRHKIFGGFHAHVHHAANRAAAILNGRSAFNHFHALEQIRIGAERGNMVGIHAQRAPHAVLHDDDAAFRLVAKAANIKRFTQTTPHVIANGNARHIAQNADYRAGRA